VLDAEGGSTVTDDPQDPGGLTKWGISQRAFPDLDIRNLTKEQAKELYRFHYFNRCRCGSFPPQIALALFDGAVNQGPHRAIQLLQKALGVTPDGVVGEETISAAQRADQGEALVDYLSHRAAHYATLNARFHRGWFRRLFKVQRAALEMA
jgi:lysozyme family protein